MSNENKDKITCNSCGSTVSKGYYSKHLKTKKCMSSKTSNSKHTYKHTEDERKTYRSNFKKHYEKKKSTMSDADIKYLQSLKKWLQRNPTKTQKDYIPMSQRTKRNSLK